MSGVKLTHIETDRKKGVEKREIITVSYDPETSNIELLSVVYEEQRFHQVGNTISYSPLSQSIDATPFLSYLDGFLEDVKAIDWENVYRKNRNCEEIPVEDTRSGFFVTLYSATGETIFLNGKKGEVRL